MANGASGITVGMATNIPPHNLAGITSGIELVAKKPECTTDKLLQVIKGPDFPTGATIIGSSRIKQYFETGKGFNYC